MWYTSSYLAGVMWLSLRLSPLYPASLTPLDPALCAATSMPQRDRTPDEQAGSQAGLAFTRLSLVSGSCCRLADRVPGRSATHTCEPCLGQSLSTCTALPARCGPCSSIGRSSQRP
eukprot:scaffold123950_cov63-Phaeocystis_antarctica.AAC.1